MSNLSMMSTLFKMRRVIQICCKRIPEPNGFCKEMLSSILIWIKYESVFSQLSVLSVSTPLTFITSACCKFGSSDCSTKTHGAFSIYFPVYFSRCTEHFFYIQPQCSLIWICISVGPPMSSKLSKTAFL